MENNMWRLQNLNMALKNGQVYITYSEILKQAREKGNEDNITQRKVVNRKII